VEDHSVSCDMGDQNNEKQREGTTLCFFVGHHKYVFQAKDLLIEIESLTLVKVKLYEASISKLATRFFLSYWDLQAVLHTLSSRFTNSFLASCT